MGQEFFKGCICGVLSALNTLLQIAIINIISMSTEALLVKAVKVAGLCVFYTDQVTLCPGILCILYNLFHP